MNLFVWCAVVSISALVIVYCVSIQQKYRQLKNELDRTERELNYQTFGLLSNSPAKYRSYKQGVNNE